MPSRAGYPVIYIALAGLPFARHVLHDQRSRWCQMKLAAFACQYHRKSKTSTGPTG